MITTQTLRARLRRLSLVPLVTGLALCLVGSAALAQAPTLGGMVEAGMAIKQGVGNVTDPLSVARRIILQLGHEMDVNVEYQPEDAPSAIHMRHDPDEPPTSRRIAIKTTLNYKYDIESKIPGADLRKLAGFDFPDKGPADKVPVRVWFDNPSIFKYTELRADVWEGMLPTWWLYTNGNGEATAYLYPLVDQPLGGVKKMAMANVRVQAMIQLKEGIPTGWFELGALAVEEIAAPTEKVVQVHVEYHEPTEWEGTVTVVRNIVSSSSTSGPEPTPEMPQRVVSKTGNSMWEGVLEITNLRLNELGTGSGQYKYTITGEGQTHTITRIRTSCDSGTQTFSDNVDVTYKAEGIEFGSANVDILVHPGNKPSYAIIVHAPGTGSSALAYPWLSMEARQEHRWQDCSGNKYMDGYIMMGPEQPVLGHLILPETIWMRNWPTFEYEASSYSDSIQWEETITNGSHSYNLLTVVEWDLRRVYK
jgi:hypothetical protein